jgi:hypothetical protein
MKHIKVLSGANMTQLPCTLINQDLLITDKPSVTFGLIHFPLDSDYKGQWSANTTHNLLDIAFVGTFDEAVRSASLWADSKNLTIKWKEPTLK